MVIILEITNYDITVLYSSAFTEDSTILYYLIYKESKKYLAAQISANKKEATGKI